MGGGGKHTALLSSIQKRAQLDNTERFSYSLQILVVPFPLKTCNNGRRYDYLSVDIYAVWFMSSKKNGSDL